MKVITTLVLFLVFTVCGAEVNSDEVNNLPGLAVQPSFKHYSGYLKATGTKRLHYWFVEAQNSPKSSPVVLWLNGGPGCSSMDGMLTEHGPFRVSTDGKSIQMNPESWNLVANMLYLEAPAGVGYSYSSDKNYATNDDQVSLDNYYALKDFFMGYPEYAQNEFYITGESYGGIYVPTLAARIVDDNHFNFKGFAVGNGMSDYGLNDASLMYFGYAHGLWGKSLWGKLVEYCCNNGNTSDCSFASPTEPSCQNAMNEAGQIIGTLNVYNMYSECYPPATGVSSASVSHRNRTMLYSTDIMLAGSHVFKNNAKKFYTMQNGGDVSVAPPCVDIRGITTYMNDPAVRKALHIPSSLPEWTICSGPVGMSYKRTYTSMKQQYLKVLNTGKVRVLVFNGDIDMACNFLMDEWFTDSLGQQVVDDTRAWMYTAKDGTQQVGGYAKHFKNLMYATVRGAGHMVPTDRPIPALTMFKAFLNGQKL